MVLLTLVEKIEIVNLARNRTYQEAAEIFNHHHPNRARPLHKVTVARLFKKFRESGDLNRKNRQNPFTPLMRPMHSKMKWLSGSIIIHIQQPETSHGKWAPRSGKCGVP